MQSMNYISSFWRNEMNPVFARDTTDGYIYAQAQASDLKGLTMNQSTLFEDG